MRENPAGEAKNGGLKLVFDRRLGLEFRGAKMTTDAGLLAVRELDAMMGLTEMAGDLIVEGRTGKNIGHQIPGLLRQSVYARLAGYEDVNDHEGLSRDPAMRAVIGRMALERKAASSPLPGQGFPVRSMCPTRSISPCSCWLTTWATSCAGSHSRRMSPTGR